MNQSFLFRLKATLLCIASTAIISSLCFSNLSAQPTPPQIILELAPTNALAPSKKPIEKLSKGSHSNNLDKSLPKVVHDTTIEASLDPLTHTIIATETIQWTNLSNKDIDELYFHAYLNAFKNQRSVFLRTAVGGGRGGKTPADWGYLDIKKMRLGPSIDQLTEVSAKLEKASDLDPDDETDLCLPLDKPVAPGSSIIIQVEFESKLPSIVERTGYQDSFHFVGQWFPKLARLTEQGQWEHFSFHRFSEFSSDFGSYHVTLKAPMGFTIGATGTKVEDRIEGGTKIERYELKNAHDFAWTAWNHFEETNQQIQGVSVKLLTPKGHNHNIQRQINAASHALTCFQKRFGSYPFENLTIVHPPLGAEEAGGMEYPSLITTGSPWFLPDRLKTLEGLVIHEFGHQFFYGVLASNEHDWPFLDEGLNTYAETACLQELYGHSTAVDLYGLQVSMEAIQRDQALRAGHDAPIAQWAPGYPTGNHYGGLVYMRTASLMRTIGNSFGREKLDAALKNYATHYRFDHPNPESLINEIEQEMGEKAAQALRVGLFEKGWVDFAILDLTARQARTPAGVFDGPTGRQISQGDLTDEHSGWAVISRRGTLIVPVDIELELADGSKHRVHWSGEDDWVRVRYHGSSALVRIVVDPDNRIELDERRDNNARSVSSTPFAWRVFDHTTYGLGLLGSLFSP